MAISAPGVFSMEILLDGVDKGSLCVVAAFYAKKGADMGLPLAL